MVSLNTQAFLALNTSNSRDIFLYFSIMSITNSVPEDFNKRSLCVSEYDINDCKIGKIRFFTYSDVEDVFSKRIREKYNLNPLVKLAVKLLNSTDTFVDLGANIGTFAIPLAKATRCRNILVEALPENFWLLQKAVKENYLNNATLLNVATYDSNGFVRIGGHSAYGTVCNDRNAPLVQCLTLDTIAEQYDCRDAHLLKIDVEGSELKTLQGGRNFFQNNDRVDVIFEANGAHCISQGYMPKDLLVFFEELGYKIYMILQGNLIPRQSKDFQEFGNIDYLATKKNLEEKEGFKLSQISFKRTLTEVLNALNNKNIKYRYFMMQELEKAPQSLIERPEVREAIKRNKR